MNGSWDYFFRQMTDWLVRRRSPALFVMRTGLALTVLGLAGITFQLSFPSSHGPVTVVVNNDGGVTSTVLYAVGILGLALILFGLVWESIRFAREERGLAKKRVIVLEVRGLRDTSGTPLSEAIPPSIEGRRESLLVNLRQRSQDGVITDPTAAVSELASLPKELERRFSEGDRRDTALVYGGLAPVPLTFLTGVLVDDEAPVVAMDWDRHQQRWRSLDGEDDERRFEIVGLQQMPIDATSAVLAVSFSYEVDRSGIASKFPNLPFVEMRLPGGTPDAHWSVEKQRALGQQFLNTVIALANRGVTQIHLFLAAQNSVVFQLGRLYDKRNLPAVVVYQYQPEHSPPFPWGIAMPVAGRLTAEVV